MRYDCGCSGCNRPAQHTCTNRCHTNLTNTDLGELIYLQGLDSSFCEKFQRLADILQLTDCAGNPVSFSTPVVTCAAFQEHLCTLISNLAVGGEAVPGVTQLLGSDCKLYTVPPTGAPVVETPNSTTSTTTLALSCSGTLCRTITGDVNVSTAAGNVLTVVPDGLYVPDLANTIPTACAQVQAWAVGADAVEGTVVLGADCLKHTLRYPDPIIVGDTASIDLTLAGSQITADWKLDPNSIGSVGPDGYLLTCANILACGTSLLPADTTTFDLTIVGDTIYGDVRLSAVQDNQLITQPDGLYVQSPCVTLASLPSGGQVIGGSTQFVGPDCRTYTFPVVQEALTVQDTPTIDLTLSGSVITANALIDTNINNILGVGGNGLIVSCTAVRSCVYSTTTHPWFSFDPLTATLTFIPSTDAGNSLTIGTDGRPYVNANVAVTNTSCISMANVAGVLSATPIISPAAGNSLQCLGDGLFVPTPPATTVAGVSSDCIATAVTLNAGVYNVQSFAVINPALDNQVQCSPNGLYVPPATATNVTVTSTSCLDLNVSNPAVGVFNISGSVVVSPAVGNQVQCTPNGLYVPTPSVTAITGSDTCAATTTVTAIGPDAWNVEADVVLSNTADNLLDCIGDGLYVPPQSISAIDTQCATLTIDQSDPLNITIQSDIVLDTDPSNIIQCTPDGLYATTQALTAINTSCASLTIDQTNPFNITLQPNVILNPITCNSLICTAAGLYVPPASVNASASAFFTQVLGAIPATGVQTCGTPVSVTFTNPSACSVMAIDVEYRVEFTVSYAASYNFQLQVVRQIDGGTPAVAQSEVHSGTKSGASVDTYTLQRTNPAQYVIGPGASTTFTVTPCAVTTVAGVTVNPVTTRVILRGITL